MKAHFFDIDTLLKMDCKAWIISKSNPNIPLMKINKSDFNIFKNGLYRSQNNKVDFNGNIFWLPSAIMNKLMVILKNKKINLSDLAISLREFIDVDLINEMEVVLDTRVISKLKNLTDSIYVICPRETKRSHSLIIEKMETKLKESGITIKSFYYISETFYNQTNDDIEYKKMRLFVQHLIGYKSDDDKFIDEEITRYDTIEYYGNDKTTLSYVDKINLVIRDLLNKTDEGMKSVIKEDIIEYRPHYVANFITDNQFNKVITKEVPIVSNTYVKSSEEFKNK